MVRRAGRRPGPDDVLLRVASCGVCASELDVWQGSADAEYPIFPGHEVSGTVERVGALVYGLWPGDPVAAWVTERGFAELSEKVAIVGYHQGGTRELPLADWNWTALQIVNAHFRDLDTIMRGMRAGMRLEAFATAVEKPVGFVKATVTMEVA